jgi:uncharacterized membrane protein YuzA (DUF378 family)
MEKMKILDWVALGLTVVGGLNWGLWGLLEFDLVETLFGSMMYVPKAIYILVGLSAAYVGVGAFKCSKSCSK